MYLVEERIEPMLGSGLTRRLATIGFATAFVLATSGCYGASSTVANGGGGLWCPVGVDLGPGHISGGGNGSGDEGSMWQPAPTAVTLQFQVTNSDTGWPIEAAAWLSFISAPSFGTVWDGTTSTGAKSIAWNGAPFAVVVDIPADVSFHMSWWIMAFDAAGNEVGFTCRPFSPT